jgi:putative membrane protein
MTGFFLRAAMAALGLWLASSIVHGIAFDDAATLLLAALLLGVVNAIVRPIVLLLTLPLSLLTLGLFIFVINAGMLALVAWFLDGFHLSGFRAALLGAIVVGLAGWVGSWLIGPRGRINIIINRQ